MLARLRENLSFKLLALVVAIMLHTYVADQQNPSQPRSFTIPITVKDLPEGLLMTAKPGSVMVNLTGTADELSRIGDMNVVAGVDLKHARIGANGGLPVDVELSPYSLHDSIAISEFRPRTVSVDLVERRRRRLPVTVAVSGTLAAGFVARKPSVLVPSMATAMGPADAVDSIAHLVVKPDITGATDTVDDDYQIIPIDAQGNGIADVEIDPDTAHVQIGIVEAGRTKEVFVTPALAGAPAPGYVVAGVASRPPTAILSGGMDQLSAATGVGTEPIDIHGATADVTKVVPCAPPPGTSITSSTVVTVTVHIMPAQPIGNGTAPPQPQAPAQTPTPAAPAISTSH